MYLYVWSKVLFVSLSGFILGYDVGSMSGVQDMVGYRLSLNLSFFPDALNSSSNDTAGSCDSQDDLETAAILGLIITLLSVGCLFGAVFSGVFSDFAGRKAALLVGAAVVACGGLLHTAAVNLWMALLGRIIGGLGIGILFQVTPLYVGEISPEKQRGRLLSVLSFYMVHGLMVGFVVNLIVKDYLFGWRISVGVQLAVGLFLVLGNICLPRSPRMLVKKHKEDRALKVLTKIYKDQDKAKVQLEEIKSSVDSSKEPFLATVKYVLQWRILYRLLLGFFLMVLTRFTGLNFITYFSVSILCSIGLPGFAASVALAGTGMIAMYSTFFIVDRVGRKPLFLLGTLVMSLCHVASAGLVLGFDLESTTVDTISTAQTVAGYFVLAFICIFMGSVLLSAGTIPWVIVGELFPLKARGFMISVSNIGFWLGLILVNQTASVFISSPLKISGTLFLYAALTFGLFLFVLLLLPETKGLTLEASIEELFSQPWSKRVNVLYYLTCGRLSCTSGSAYIHVDSPMNISLENLTPESFQVSEDRTIGADSKLEPG